MQGNIGPICPPIIHAAFFNGADTMDIDTATSALELSAQILSVSIQNLIDIISKRGNEEVKKVMEFLLLNSFHSGISLIVMPALNSITLDNYLRIHCLHQTRCPEIFYVFAMVYIQIVRMYNIGYLHLDLHENNVLLLMNDDTQRIGAQIIDFGEVQQVKDPCNIDDVIMFNQCFYSIQENYLKTNPKGAKQIEYIMQIINGNKDEIMEQVSIILSRWNPQLLPALSTPGFSVSPLNIIQHGGGMKRTKKRKKRKKRSTIRKRRTV